MGGGGGGGDGRWRVLDLRGVRQCRDRRPAADWPRSPRDTPICSCLISDWVGAAVGLTRVPPSAAAAEARLGGLPGGPASCIEGCNATVQGAPTGGGARAPPLET